MNLLILGAGMYVTGRHGSGIGTVLTSTVQALGNDSQHSVIVCATSEANRVVVVDTVDRIQHQTGITAAIDYIAYNGSSEELEKLVRNHRIDVAIVSTPDHLHFSQLSILLGLGVHCLCVKPLVPTLKEHQTLVDLAEQHYAHAVIEVHKRWDESNLLAKKLIGAAKLGRLHNFSVDYSQRILIPTEVFSGWVERTNIFQYLGIHYVDLILWLAGAVPIRLCCRGTRGILADKGIDTWDSVHVWMIARQQNGDEFLAQFNLSWIDSNLSPALSDQRLSILGSTGRLELDQRNRGISATLSNEPMQYLNPWFSELLPAFDGYLEMQGYAYKSITQFLEDSQRIITGKATASEFFGRRPTFRDCRDSTHVIDVVTHCLVDGQDGFVDL